MYLVISVFWLISFSGLLTFVFRKKVVFLIPLSFFISIFILYFFAFFKKLHIGYYFIIALCIIFWLYFIYCFIKKRNLIKEFLNNYLTIGMLVYLILFVAINAFYSDMWFSCWDEFMHWGPMVSALIKHDTFYSIQEAILKIHKDYPPFYPLLGYLFSCFKNINYQENRLYIAHFSFVFSLYMPLFAKLNKKSVKDYFVAFLMTCGIILLGLLVHYTPEASDKALFYNCVYIDWSIAVLTAYSFCVVWYKDDNFRYINIVLSFMALVSAKQIGMPFFLLSLLLFLIKEFLIDKKKINAKHIFVVFAPIAIYFIWKFYTYSVGALQTAQFSSSQINLKDFVNIAFHNGGEAWQQESFHVFLNALLSRYLIITPFKLNYVFSSLFIFLLFVILFFISSKNYKKTIIATGFVFLFGTIAYAFMMLLLYCFSFGPSEGPTIASFNRYMISYLYIGFCSFFMLAYQTIDMVDSNLLLKHLIITIVIASLCDYNALKYLSNYDTREYNNEKYISSLKKGIEYATQESGDKVLIVEQYAPPIITEYMPKEFWGIIEPYLLSLDGYFDNGNAIVRLGERGWDTLFTIEPTLDEWETMLSKYDILILTYVDSYFLENYWTEDFNAYNYSIYKINKNDGNVSLEYFFTYFFE